MRHHCYRLLALSLAITIGLAVQPMSERNAQSHDLPKYLNKIG